MTLNCLNKDNKDGFSHSFINSVFECRSNCMRSVELCIHSLPFILSHIESNKRIFFKSRDSVKDTIAFKVVEHFVFDTQGSPNHSSKGFTEKTSQEVNVELVNKIFTFMVLSPSRFSFFLKGM